jgi:hypothetical protein
MPLFLFSTHKQCILSDREVRGHCMCKEMPAIPVDRVAGMKRIIGKNGGPRMRRGTKGRWPINNAYWVQFTHNIINMSYQEKNLWPLAGFELGSWGVDDAAAPRHQRPDLKKLSWGVALSLYATRSKLGLSVIRNIFLHLAHTVGPSKFRNGVF